LRQHEDKSPEFANFRPKVSFETIQHPPVLIQGEPRVRFKKPDIEQFIARYPLQVGVNPILVITSDNGQLFCTNGLVNFGPEDCEILGDACQLMPLAMIRASFEAAAKTDRHIISLGSDAYATLKYLCAGGKLKGKPPKFDR